jgi:hypothetical protein
MNPAELIRPAKTRSHEQENTPSSLPAHVTPLFSASLARVMPGSAKSQYQDPWQYWCLLASLIWCDLGLFQPHLVGHGHQIACVQDEDFSGRYRSSCDGAVIPLPGNEARYWMASLAVSARGVLWLLLHGKEGIFQDHYPWSLTLPSLNIHTNSMTIAQLEQRQQKAKSSRWWK